MNNSSANKREQIAKYLLQHGGFMSARQMVDAGFQFEGELETTVAGVSSVLNKLHQSRRFTVQRKECPEQPAHGGRVDMMVKVTGIKAARSDHDPVAKVGTQPNLWRQLATRRPGGTVAVKAGDEG